MKKSKLFQEISDLKEINVELLNEIENQNGIIKEIQNDIQIKNKENIFLNTELLIQKKVIEKEKEL